ncbi:MAG: hypothetical protein P1U65_18710 [Minwuia sp.]|nr:hypothetical protein [Minwuia sp.]
MNEKSFAELFALVHDTSPTADVPATQQDQVHKTMSDLIAASPGTSDPIVLLGYLAAGDGGGGVFRYDAAKSRMDHDGGHVVDPTRSYPSLTGFLNTASNNSGTGCWVRDTSTWAPEMWGATGDGTSDDSEPWNSFAAYLAANGGKGVLSGHYKITLADKLDIDNSNGMELEGSNNAAMLDAGTSDVILFDLVRGGLTVRNLTLKGATLFYTNETTTQDFDHIILEDVFFDNSGNDVHSAAVRLQKSGSTVPKINRFRAVNVRVEGGLGGLEIEAGIEHFHVDNYVCRNVSIADNTSYFQGDDMLNLGYGAGLGLGFDDPESAELTKYGYIGSVFVDGVEDNRVQEGSGVIANVDGVRIHAANVNFDTIHISNVNSHSKTDCVGLYLKAHRCRGDKVTVIDAGNHEGMVVFKGARRADPDDTTTGFNASINEVQLIGTQVGFANRSGVFCGVDDIHIGRLYMENIGGSVEDPYNTGSRLGGHGALFHTADTSDGPKRRLRIDSMEVIDCTLDNPSGQAVRAIDLNGYAEVIVDRLVLDGVTQGGGFTGTDGRLIMVGVIGTSPFTHCEFGSILEQNTVSSSDDTTLFQADTDVAGYGDVIIRNAIVTSDAIDIGIKVIGDVPIATLEVQGGDLSRVTDTALDISENVPVKIRIRNVNGLPDQPAVNPNNQAGFRARFGFAPPLLFPFEFGGGLESVSLSRASLATGITVGGGPRAVAADTPRLTHDAVTGEPLGLLLEPESTNYCLTSEDLTDVSWTTGSNLSITADKDDPSGTTRAVELKATSSVDGTSDTHYFRTDSTVSSAANSVASVWVRRVTGSGPITLLAPNGSATSGTLDISGNIDDRWARVSVSGTSGASEIHVGIAVETNGDAIEIAFPQAEQTSLTTPTSYIPTSGTVVTRPDEDARIDLTLFEGFRKEGYTILVDAIVQGDENVLLAVAKGSNNDIELDLQSGNVRVTGVNGLNMLVTSNLSPGDNLVAAIRVRPDDVAVSINGATVVKDTSRSAYGLAQFLQLGSDITGDDGVACTIRQVAFFGPLDDATLVAMSGS